MIHRLTSIHEVHTLGHVSIDEFFTYFDHTWLCTHQSCLLRSFNIQYSNEYDKCREIFLSLLQTDSKKKCIISWRDFSFMLCIIRFQNLMLPPNTRNAPFASFPSFILLCFYIGLILLRSYRCMVPCLCLIIVYSTNMYPQKYFFCLCFKIASFHLIRMKHTFDFFFLASYLSASTLYSFCYGCLDICFHAFVS